MIKPRAELQIRYFAPDGGLPLSVHVRNSEDALLRVRHLAEFVDRATLFLVTDDGRQFSMPEFERAMGARPLPPRRAAPDADMLAAARLSMISVSEAESSAA